MRSTVDLIDELNAEAPRFTGVPVGLTGTSVSVYGQIKALARPD